MKKLSILLIILLPILWSCNDDDKQPTLSEEELFEITFEKITENEEILEAVFTETEKVITEEAINKAIQDSKGDKKQFFVKMNSLVDGLFEKEIQNNTEQLAGGVNVAVGDVTGDGRADALVQLLLSAPLDPLNEYAKNIKKQITTNQKWTTIKKFVPSIEQESASNFGILLGGGGQELPSESFSLNYEEINTLIDLKDILASGDKTDDELDNALTPVFIEIDGIKGESTTAALLLPAIQKVREYNGTSNTATTPYLKWMHNEIKPKLSGGLTKAKIRKYNTAGYLGAIEMLISNDYKNDNQDVASMLLLKARYRASLIFIWNELYPNPQ